MMKLLRKSGILLILGCLIFCSNVNVATPVMAQDIMTTQASKTQSKLAAFAAKIQENFQRVISNISESQFGKTIGKGLSAAKKAVNTAKTYYNKAMSAYKNTVAAAKASKAYQALQLSKKLAKEEKKLETLNKEREDAVQTLEDAAETEIEALQVKENEEAENAETAREIYQQQLEEAATEATRAVIQEKIDALDENTKTRKSFKQSLSIAKIKLRLEGEKLSVQAKYAKKIAKQMKVIAAIGVEIANLYSKKKTKDPDTTISEAKTKFNFGFEMTSADMDTQTGEANEATKKTAEEFEKYTVNSGIGSPDGDKGDAKRTADGIETTAGKSDAAVQMAQALAKQLTALKNDIMSDALYLQVETSAILTQAKASVTDGLTTIDICNYTSEEQTAQGNILDQLKETKNAVTATATSAVGSVGSVAGTVNSLQDTATETATGLSKQAQDQIDAAKATADALKAAGTSAASTVTSGTQAIKDATGGMI